jgi:hypothetical protein
MAPIESIQLSFDALNAPFEIFFYLMFPDVHDRPPIATKKRSVPTITRDISVNLFTPVGGKLVRPAIELPAMPKIAINEYRELDFGENDVWFAYNPSRIYAKAVSTSVKFFSNGKLHFRVAASNSRHCHAPLFGRHIVSHD